MFGDLPHNKIQLIQFKKMESPKVTTNTTKNTRGQGCKNSQETLGNSRGFFGYQDHIFAATEMGVS